MLDVRTAQDCNYTVFQKTILFQCIHHCSYIFYEVSLVNVSCRRRWPPPTSDNAIGLVAQCELSGTLNWASFWRQLGGNFHTVLATLPQLGVVRWPSARYRLRQPKLTPVSLISMASTHLQRNRINAAKSTSH